MVAHQPSSPAITLLRRLTVAPPRQPRTHRPLAPPPAPWDTPNRGLRLCVRLLAWYLLFAALACTSAPPFTQPSVSVVLTALQIPVCLWTAHRFTRQATAADQAPQADRAVPRAGQSPWS